MSNSLVGTTLPPGSGSWATWLSSHPVEQRKFLRSLSPAETAHLEYEWRFWARASQWTPAGNWRYWLLLAGRGFGKTRTGAEWVRDLAERGVPKRFGIALVGATVDDARDILVEGESGLLNICPAWNRPVWNGSTRTLTWPNGEWARTYSADRPDRLRGKQHAYAWADELAAWRYPDAWVQLMLGLRLGVSPQCVVTTTPRPTPLIKQLVSDPETRVTKGSTYDNRGNLAQDFIRTIVKQFEGTRLGRQELHAEILDDNPAALWKRATLDALRERRLTAREIAKRCKRIIIAVDPAVTNTESSDETGIIVAGLGPDGHGYVLDDLSGKFEPAEWARRVVWFYKEWEADRIVAEVNQGGDLVEQVLRAVDANVAITQVRASRGKSARAEPVAALYEQGKVHHVGCFTKLEDQLCEWDPVNHPKSPDRLDAVVWALTFLMLAEQDPKRGALPPSVAALLG